MQTLSPCHWIFLLLILFLAVTALLGVATGNTTGAATTEGRLRREVNVLLGVQADQEARHVHGLLADDDVTLDNENTSVVDGAGKTQLEDLGLQTTLQEVLDGQSQDVIELHLILGEHTRADQLADQSVTLKETLLVLLVTGQQVTSRTADLGQLETDTVKLTLVTETVLTAELQLSIKTAGLVRTLRRGVSFRLRPRSRRHC